MWHGGATIQISANGFGSGWVELLREGSQRAVLDIAHHWLGWKRGDCVCCDPINGVRTLST